MKRTLLCSLLLGLAGTGQALASTVVPLSTDDMALLADAVVVGQVEDQTTRLESGMIYTDIVLDIQEVWKGSLQAPTHLVVRTLGGEHNGVVASVAGSPGFARGEETLLYLEQNKKGEWKVLGLNQGKWHIQRQPDGTRKALHFHLPMELGGKDLTDTQIQGKIQSAHIVFPILDLRGQLEETLSNHTLNVGVHPKDLKRFKGIGR